MKLETFFAKFDLFADAPDAVAKMRGLLIHFAVTGKLVPNDRREKPVALILSGALPEGKGLPSNWRCGLLGDAFTFEYGDNLPAPKRTETGEYPVYGSNGIVGTHDTYLTKEPAIIVGRKGSAGALNIANGPSWTTDVAYFVHPPKDLDLRFTYYLFSTLCLDELGKGIKPGLNRNEAYALPIALPPLGEQKRIVAKVDELMALCDRLEAHQQERESRQAALSRASLARFAKAPTPANLSFIFHKSYDITPADLRKSILTIAVQGDLSAGSSNPAEWSAVTMKDVCDLITDGEHATPLRVPSGIPLATAKNVRDGFLDMTQTDYVTPATAEKCWKRCKPKHGDILMVCVGATTGRVCLVTSPPEMVLVRSVALLRPNSKRIEGTFLDLFLRSPSGQSQIWRGVRQNAQPCLYLGRMSEFTLQLPPLFEQRRIVAKVRHLMALVDALEMQLAASSATARNLLNAIVAELSEAQKVQIRAAQG
jgi:type I restriction enzyme, S subunit